MALTVHVRGVGRPRLPRRALRLEAVQVPPNGRSRHFLPADYRQRETPAYYPDDPPPGIAYQPDVYALARRLARRSGAPRIVDIGSGSGEKVAAFQAELEIIGLDVGENLARAREQHPHCRWLEHDLDSGGPLPLEPDQLAGAVLICADVIEHLRDPRNALATLHAAMEEAVAVLISTPDRDRLSGGVAAGPPLNPSHTREWTRDEFAALLKDAGFTGGLVTYTRPHTGTLSRSTILAVLAPPENRSLLRRSTWLVP